VTDRHFTPLLELDPDLGQLLNDERLATAARELRVAVHSLDVGPWDVEKLSGASSEHVGLLVLDGVIAREVLVSDIVSTELLGPGDVVRPWRLHDGSALLRHSVRWIVLTRSRFALLDRRFSIELGRYPEINAAIIDRVSERALRLGVTQAISQLNRVDRRLLALFWHLAERWGRMTGEGVALPMTLSHRMLGQLVGARRPTVSTALSALAKQGELARRGDGTWLLTGAPVGMPAPELERVIPMRRRLLPPERTPRPAVSSSEAPVVVMARAAPAGLAPVHVGGVELREVLDRLRRQCEAQVDEMRAAVLMTAQLAEQTSALRERCRITRTGVRAAVDGAHVEKRALRA
jgi:CRP/FNR family transcriptional regulator, cyclic AMP receptor protein